MSSSKRTVRRLGAQSLVRLSKFMPVCSDHLSQRFRNTESRGGNHVWKGLSWRVRDGIVGNASYMAAGIQKVGASCEGKS